MHLASRSTRWLGQLLDGLITALPIIPAFMLFAINETLGSFAMMGVLLFSLVYYFFADSLPGGQSFGKRLMGVAVVDKHTHAPCSPGQSFVRNLLLAVLGIIDWVFIFGDERQRLGDMLAGTIVVQAAAVQHAGYVGNGIAAG
ncbi:MAG TPA: RDD family protein [Longimicrobium sp.]|nr:RDD family protein [Longimicrobium sp.]